MTEPLMLDKRGLTISQFAHMYSLNPKTVQVDVTRAPEKLPKITRYGRSIRFTLKAIDEWEVAMTAK